LGPTGGASRRHPGDAALLEHLRGLMAELPRELALGLYECPSPYRRLLSDEHVRFCAGSGRFVALKDVSCDLATVSRCCAIAEGSPFAIVNANAAIAWEAVRAGSRGFCGITNNFYPDLYAWLLAEGGADRPHAAELAAFLGICGMVELLGYPAVAKRFHQRLGTFASTMCRSVPPDVLEHHWALDALLDQMNVGAEFHRDRTTRARVGTARQTR
ncbi:MAG: hypothetical protein ACE5FS_15920, partial [Paracoccaceae bacterium]